MSVIAYAGEVELEEARWDNRFGMTVKLKLKQQEHELNAANPFKRFTKMRKDKVGTRFAAQFTCADSSTFYDNEVMLKGWSDGTTGWRLTLWVNADSDGLHPFMSVANGDAFALAMVELDDDNHPIDQEKRDNVTAAVEARTKSGPRLSVYAASLCRERSFWRYVLRSIASEDGPGGKKPQNAEEAEAMSANWMRRKLGITSRSELDRKEDAAARFHDEIRRPYSEFVTKGERHSE